MLEAPHPLHKSNDWLWYIHRLLGTLVIAGLGGCVPSLSVTPIIPTGPTVAELQDHVTCVLAKTLDKHLKPGSSDRDLWQHLITYNFIGNIVFTVFVTQSEGLNPSFNFITPLTNLGNPILKTVESSNGLTNVANGTGTSNANNFTLAVGFQLNGSQDRNILYNYLVDVAGLDANLEDMKDNDGNVVPGLRTLCADPSKLDPPRGIPYGLNGDLALEEMLESGLQALDGLKYYPVGNQGAAKSNQQAPSQATSQGAGNTPSFSAKIDFNLLWGVNGGPNWTLLSFKGPGGGGGSGSGGSGGGGGGSQLLNYSRSKQDTLIATFNATCKTDSTDEFMGLTKDPLSSTQSSSQVVVKGSLTYPPDQGSSPNTEVHPNTDVRAFLNGTIPNDGPIGASTGAIYVTQKSTNRQGVGNVSWSGYVDASTKPNPTMAARGSITDAIAGTFVGYVYLFGEIKKVNDKRYLMADRIKVTSDALSTLLTEVVVPGAISGQYQPTYWESIASCAISRSVVPSPLNLLQQLSPDVGSVFLQQ